MITETELWKADLVKTADSLLKRMVQQKWSQRSFFRLEKEIFVGFFCARKLIESKAVPPQIASKKFELIRFPALDHPGKDLQQRLPYDTTPERNRISVSIRSVCNLFIHSWHIAPFGANGILAGFFVTTEFESKKGIYLILVFQMVEALRLCAGREGIIDAKTDTV